MNYRMVEEKGCLVIGKEVIVHKDAYTEIPAFAEKIWNDGTHDRINECAGRPAGSLLFGYYYDFNEDGTKRYLMGTVLPEGQDVPEELDHLSVPDQTYAVFDSRDTYSEDTEMGMEILNVWRRIYAEWFPSAGFEQAEGPCMEKYYWTDDSHEESICEVWIPVVKK